MSWLLRFCSLGSAVVRARTTRRVLHSMGSRPRALFASALLASFLIGKNAAAAGPLGANGEAITTSNYAIDLFQGPVLAGTRVSGMGGAYVALSEGIDGSLQNPATPAVRPFHSHEHFDYYPVLGITFPALVKASDFFNSGARSELLSSPDSFVFITPGINLQYGTFGIGLTLELQNYSFRDLAITSIAEGVPGATTENSTLGTVITTGHLQIANAFFDGQLVAGAGARFLTMEIDTLASVSEAGVLVSEGEAVFSSSGAGFELGLVWRPNHEAYRLGVAYRSAIETQAQFSSDLLPNEDRDIVINPETPFFLPDRVSLPWDLNLGVAFQLGKRALNPHWQSIDDIAELDLVRLRLEQLEREREQERVLLRAAPEQRASLRRRFDKAAEADRRKAEAIRERAREQLRDQWRIQSRRYVLVSASLLITGNTEEAVGIESFLSQTVNRSGRGVVISPRIGVETETWSDLLKLRAGTYIEPTRFEISDSRLHGTLGFDVRLGNSDIFGIWPKDYVWRLSAVVDVAESYFAWGLGIGGWFPRVKRVRKQ